MDKYVNGTAAYNYGSAVPYTDIPAHRPRLVEVPKTKKAVSDARTVAKTMRGANIEIVENKPLARMLYANVDVGQEIPPELYQAVAEVLAMVYNMKNNT